MNHSIYNPDLLNQDYYVSLSAYYYRSKNEHVMDAHSHNRIEFMYVTQGYCTITAGETTYRLSKGQIIFIDANIKHDLVIPLQENCRMLNLEFTFTTKPSATPSVRILFHQINGFDLFFKQNKSIVHLTDSGILMDSIKKIIIQRERFLSDLKLQLLICLFIYDFMSIYLDCSSEKVLGTYVSNAINYMISHYDSNMKASEIASEIGLHPNYLHRIFKQQTGLSMIDYLNRIRLNRAKKLLATTRYSIQDISEFVGYNSRQYFTAKFQIAFGISPAEYRNSTIPWQLFDDVREATS